DTAEPAAQLSEDTRWSALAFGEIEDDGRAAVQLRHANGELLTGSYERTGEGTVELSLRPLREPGTSLREHPRAIPSSSRWTSRSAGTAPCTSPAKGRIWCSRPTSPRWCSTSAASAGASAPTTRL